MAENMNNNMCDVCGSGNGRCGRCGNMCGFSGSHIIRWVLGALIIMWVFSIGMRIGELKASLESNGYGRGAKHMQMYYGQGYGPGAYTQYSPVQTVTTGTVR